jgi:hypothetical protein
MANYDNLFERKKAMMAEAMGSNFFDDEDSDSQKS